MKSLAALTCAALLAATAPDTQATGRFSRALSGGGSVAPRAFHHHHGHATVIVRGGFIGWPGPYFWPGYYYAPAYYYAPPVIAAPPPAPAYWYYCAPAGAYYPYVHECPGGWQLVTPHPY